MELGELDSLVYEILEDPIHCWCTQHDRTARLFPLFEFMDGHDGLLRVWREMNSQMWHCTECIEQYWASKLVFKEHDLKAKFTSESVDAFMGMVGKLDVRRAKEAFELIESLPEGDANREEVLANTFYEIFRFPFVFLSDQPLNTVFTRHLLSVQESGGEVLTDSGTERFAGIYMLLLHPEPGVRSWAQSQVKKMPPVSAADFSEVIAPVVERWVQLLEFDLFQPEGTAASNTPASQGVMAGVPAVTRRVFWGGFYVLLR
jgi:hypothetical protein